MLVFVMQQRTALLKIAALAKISGAAFDAYPIVRC